MPSLPVDLNNADPPPKFPARGRLLVCGGRDYTDFKNISNTLDEFNRRVFIIDVLIHGNARGADTLADIWAQGCGRKSERYPAEWERMLVEGRPHAVLAFPGGRGTQDMMDRALANGVPVIQSRDLTHASTPKISR